MSCERKESSCFDDFGERNNGKNERVHVLSRWLPLLPKKIVGSLFEVVSCFLNVGSIRAVITVHYQAKE